MGCPFFAHPRFGPQKSLFFASGPRFWACCPHVFSFSFTSILCFSSWFLHISPFFCQIFCLSKSKLADLGSNLLCFWWSSHANFAEFSDLYGWNYPARPLYGWNYTIHPSVRLKLPSTPSVWLKLHNTPFCTVEITQHTPCMVEITQYALCMVEITQHALLYGWNYPARPSVWFNLPSTPFCMV